MKKKTPDERKHAPRIIVPVDDQTKEKVAVAVIRHRLGTTSRFVREAIDYYIRYLDERQIKEEEEADLAA